MNVYESPSRESIQDLIKRPAPIVDGLCIYVSMWFKILKDYLCIYVSMW